MSGGAATLLCDSYDTLSRELAYSGSNLGSTLSDSRDKSLGINRCYLWLVALVVYGKRLILRQDDSLELLALPDREAEGASV